MLSARAFRLSRVIPTTKPCVLRLHRTFANQRAVLSQERPNDVGILGMEMYIPNTYVAQEDLEKFDGVSAGKYTKGLGQHRMAFCGDREDINSMCLTAVQQLIEKYDIDPKQIGRLEVGTETFVDKSKSVKSVVMQLFEKSGNTAIEGVDTTNACYGGTSALFNALHWIESSYWDGRYAIVVAADIALYEPGPARPTGGAGAVAMLIGPNAPLAFERGLRGTEVNHAWDFYKPNLSSEYPVVDGKLSNDLYLQALDRCYQRYKAAYERLSSSTFSSADAFDYAIFHQPYGKLVQKSWARLLYMDYLNNVIADQNAVATLNAFRGLSTEESYNHRDLMKALTDLSTTTYTNKVTPGMGVGCNVGNSYCGSLYAGILSLISTVDLKAGNRIGLFSYGSGLAATLFSLRVNQTPSRIRDAARIFERLDSRKKITPEAYTKTLSLREQVHNASPYQPIGSLSDLAPGTFYLSNIDNLNRRHYERVRE